MVMELQNPMLTITLAKINAFNPSILDHADLDNIWVEEPTDDPISDILPVASVNVLLSPNMLHFVIKFPKIKIAFNKAQFFRWHTMIRC